MWRTITALICAASASIVPASVAKAAPPATTHASAVSVIDEGYPSLTILKQKGWRVPRKCDLEIVHATFRAGWKTPGQQELILGIGWRESNWRPLDESSPWYSGALGFAQIQTSAWSGQPWWSRANMLDIETQARIIKQHFFKKGLMWHWGMGFSKKKDDWYFNTHLYNNLWGSALVQAWVIDPFLRGVNMVPKKCKLKPRYVKVPLVEWSDR